METTAFKKLFEENCKKIKLEKVATAFFKESNDSIVFVILRKSSYSRKYYLRVKTEIKPIESNFDKTSFIKHDIANIMMSLDSEASELFDLENKLSDNERIQEMHSFFSTNVTNWIEVLLSKNKIIEIYKNGNLSLLPYSKEKLGLS